MWPRSAHRFITFTGIDPFLGGGGWKIIEFGHVHLLNLEENILICKGFQLQKFKINCPLKYI